MKKYTASHRTLPFGTWVEVTATKTGRKVQVRINDLGPHAPDRVIDLSKQAAQEIGLVRAGAAEVEVRVVRQHVEPELH